MARNRAADPDRTHMGGAGAADNCSIGRHSDHPQQTSGALALYSVRCYRIISIDRGFADQSFRRRRNII